MWLRRYLSTEDATTRLVCFPHAGGAAAFYLPVARAHGHESDVIVLQYPGRHERRKEPLISTIDDYADRIADILAPLPALPTVFFGHSMGATIGFEVIHRLAAVDAETPACLVASGRRAPSTHREDRTHLLDDDGVLAEIKHLNGTETALLDDDEVLRMALPAIRNDYRAIETYPPRPDRVIAAAITVLVGEDDPMTTAAEADSWREHTTGIFRIHRFPGGHFYLTTQQAAVNRVLAEELAAAPLVSTTG
jgi:surfactin synthase thioesterase subunit